MKVKDLISDLSEMDQEAEITVQMGEGCGGPGDSYDISGTDFWEASEKYKTPASAFIEIDKGCFCDGHRGTALKKLNMGPQNISQFYLGLEEAFSAVSVQLKWYTDELARIGVPKDYPAHLEKEKYEQAKRALENSLKAIGKLQNRGEKS